MASLAAHMADLAVRWQVKRRMRGRPDIAAVRRMLGAAPMPAPPGIAFRPDRVGGIAGEWAEAPGNPADAPALLYLHGGAFIACSPRTHRALTGWFARAGFRVFAPDYRLAPEHPFPGGLEDCVAAWRGLPPGGVIAGDSAGGNLAMGVMLAQRDAGGPMPAAAVLLSPALDLTGASPSLLANARRDAMLTYEGLRGMAEIYLQGGDAAQPLASPLMGDLAGLPPVLVHVGEREMLRDDAVRLAEKARAAGVPVELRVWPVVPHVWQLAHTLIPEARESLEAAAAFLHRHRAGR